jgi:hypothetical protein
VSYFEGKKVEFVNHKLKHAIKICFKEIFIKNLSNKAKYDIKEPSL